MMVASILNILDDELVQNVGNYILSCQTYEGGSAGEPGTEAHGGYTFCGLATMILINKVNRLDLTSLIDWLVFRQGVELGFQGRTNKLVDGCYSFWQVQRALPVQLMMLTMLIIILPRATQKWDLFLTAWPYSNTYSFARRTRRMDSETNMGSIDFYHTCYCLNGQSACQHNWPMHEDSPPLPGYVLGPYSNLLEPIHPSLQRCLPLVP